MNRLFLILPLLALAAAPARGADEPALVARAYVLPYASGCFVSAETVKKENSESGWKDFFSQCGVEWPEGSYVRRSRNFDCWIVRNTEENHLRIREILRPLDGGPALQVRVQTHFCAFTPAAFEALELSETVGTMLARVKADVECIFPTEYDVTMFESAATASDTNAPAQFVAAAVEPQNFQTREVGQRFQVTPRVSSSGSCISLDLTPSLVLPPTWRNYGSPVLDGAADPVKPELEQPFFPVAYVATSVDIRSGYTVALGGGVLDEPVAGRRFHVFFVTASLVEMEPPIVSEPDL